MKLLNDSKKRIKLKIRSKISGSENKPRLTIFRSNKFVYGQLINDALGQTIGNIISKVEGKNKVDASFEAGKLIAKVALEKNIKEVVFDRNGYKYHGRVKSFAEGAREGGLKF
jgi:large subunit ribosomal protein L18